MTKLSIWKQGAKDGLPVFFGYLAVSFSFGIAAQGVLSPVEGFLMSATNYTSAGQFAALSLIAASAGFWEMAAAQLVINLRYSLMSCCIAQKLERGTAAGHRFFIALGLTDEVFGLSAAVKGRLSPIYVYGLMSSALPGWVLGTVLGLASSTVMPPRLMSAMGIAIYGMFIAVIFPPVRDDRRLALIIAVAMVLSAVWDQVALLAHLTAGLKLIGLTLAITGVAAILFPLENPDEASAGRCAAKCEEGAG